MRSLVQVVGGTPKRMAGFVTDNTERQTTFFTAHEKFQHAGKWVSLLHTGSIDVTLQCRPDILQTTLAQMITYLALAGRDSWDEQAPLHSDAMEELIVADNGIVKVNPDQHRGAYSNVMSIRG